jgi:chromosome segregation ATPase
MGLAQLIQTVEGRIVHFGQSLCGDRRMRLQEEADLVSEDLHERYLARVRRRADREEAKQYLAGLEIEETLLSSRVEVCVRAKEPASAWQQALQLERVRQLAKAERDRLHRLEERIEEGEAEILELETRLARLQEKLYS